MTFIRARKADDKSFSMSSIERLALQFNFHDIIIKHFKCNRDYVSPVAK